MSFATDKKETQLPSTMLEGNIHKHRKTDNSKDFLLQVLKTLFNLWMLPDS